MVFELDAFRPASSLASRLPPLIDTLGEAPEGAISIRRACEREPLTDEDDATIDAGQAGSAAAASGDGSGEFRGEVASREDSTVDAEEGEAPSPIAPHVSLGSTTILRGR